MLDIVYVFSPRLLDEEEVLISIRTERRPARACVCLCVCVYLLMYVCEYTLGSVDFIVHSARVSKDFVSSFSLESVDEQFLDSGSETELLLSISLCISIKCALKNFF